MYGIWYMLQRVRTNQLSEKSYSLLSKEGFIGVLKTHVEA